MKPEEIEQYKRLVKWSRVKIVDFVNEFIIDPYNKNTGAGVFITGQQKSGLKAICRLVNDKVDGKEQDKLGVSIMAGKGLGKDALASWVLLWFMFCFPFPKVPCISVSADQLDKVLWAELSKWMMYSPLKDFITLQADKVFRKDVPDDVRGKQWFGFKKAANPKKMSADEQVETLAGLHADYLLQIVDEGSGIANLVYETLEKNQTGICNLMFLIFNPMHAKGYALDTQYKFSHRWVTMRWSAEDSEIVNQANVKRLEEDYGRDSNTFRMNVLGLPPIFDESTLLNWEWVIDAVERNLTVLPEMPLVQSLDCGAGGDTSIIGSRRGNTVFTFKKFSSSNSIEVVNWAGHTIDTDQPDTFRVDTIGIGWAVEGSLREKKGGIVEAADSRRSADNPERFANKRAEMFWTLRELFEKGLIDIPNDPNLLSQLGALKYKPNAKGRTQISEKSEMKKEVGESPNEADALAMLYYYPENLTSKMRKVNIIDMMIRGGTWMSG